jgi:chemotaxis protein MotB
MFNKFILSIAIFSSVFLFSCVSSKKYKEANAELNQLKETTAQQATENAALQSKVSTLSSANTSMSTEFSSYRNSCENTQKQLGAYKAAQQEEDEKLQVLTAKLEKALVDFADKGVEVHAKDGRVYVNMEDNLLYKSGSAKLGDEGKLALGNLALALHDYPNLKIIVVGHTDDKKFKTANSDNLSLSTERANGVVRLLRDDFQIEPTRLTAAGQGKYSPVADNTTEEGRAKNRRTEIILNPDIDKLLASLK